MEKTPKGKLIVIEGLDGTGKSTQVELIGERLAKLGIKTLQFHEPDGVPISHEIRDIIKNGSLERRPLTNVLLFTATRGENYHQAMKPSMDDGVWPLLARNAWSTEAYQGEAEGVNKLLIRALTRLATSRAYTKPDFSRILRTNDETERARRIAARGPLDNPDTFESRDEFFHYKTDQGYLKIARRRHVPIIDASRSIEEVNDEIWNEMIREGLLKDYL